MEIMLLSSGDYREAIMEAICALPGGDLKFIWSRSADSLKIPGDYMGALRKLPEDDFEIMSLPSEE